MTTEFLTLLTQRYHAYVETFRDGSGTLPEMLRLKLEHTHGVVADARRVMAGEAWPETLRPLGEACALLHDAGRYSQMEEFGTLQDSKSIDHAKRGVQVILAQRWLGGLPGEERKLVLAAVALHNRRTLPPALLEDEAIRAPGSMAALAHLVRDADKLDIFRVMEHAVRDGSLERNPEIAWGLQVKGAPSPDVVAAISQGHSVSYAWIKTLSDFVLIQVGWLIGGLRYDTSYRLAAERQALEFREAFLKTLSDDPGVNVCCRAARAYLSKHTIVAAPAHC
jgi:hypothetical protein